MTRSLLIVCLLVVSTRNASADPSARHALRWTRAPSAERCIDLPALTAAVEERLGRPVFTTGDATIIIEAHVRPLRPGWHVAISVRAADGAALGERELEDRAQDCRALDDALALVIALIVDPDAAMRARPPPAPPPPAPAPPVPPVPQPTPPPPDPPAPTQPWHVTASVSAIGAALVLPGASIGGVLRLTIEPPSLPPIALRGTLWREDEQLERAQGARFRLFTAGLATCPRVWRLELCSGLELGRMAGDGFGFDRSEQSAAIVTYLTLEPHLTLPLSTRFALTSSIGTWIPLVRPRFVFDQVGEAVLLYQPAPIAILGHIGLALRF